MKGHSKTVKGHSKTVKGHSKTGNDVVKQERPSKTWKDVLKLVKTLW